VIQSLLGIAEAIKQLARERTRATVEPSLKIVREFKLIGRPFLSFTLMKTTMPLNSHHAFTRLRWALLNAQSVSAPPDGGMSAATREKGESPP